MKNGNGWSLGKHIGLTSSMSNVADDFGYICLDKGGRELVNVVDSSKHNAETSHAQRLKQ